MMAAVSAPGAVCAGSTTKNFDQPKKTPTKDGAINNPTLSRKTYLEPVPNPNFYPSYEKESGGPGTDPVGVLAPPPPPSHPFIPIATQEIHK